MAIIFPCPACGTTIRAPETSIGKKAKCPKCGDIFTVTDPGAGAAPPPPQEEEPPPRRTPGREEEVAPRRRWEDEDEEVPARRRDRDEDYPDDEGPLGPPGYRPSQGGAGLGIASMVLGIVGLFFSFCCYTMVISLPCAVMAIIFGIMGLKGEGRGMAIAGLITGGIAILLSIGFVILGIFFGILNAGVNAGLR
jgi:hypothetical protein